MRGDLIDDVKIVEPPIGELSKKNSSIKRSCLTGCGCVFLFIIGIIITIRLIIGPGPQAIKTLPDNFPIDIPIYDKDTIEKMTFISGRYKSRGIEIAAFFPKIILSPLLLAVNHNDTATVATNTATLSLNSAKQIWKLVSTPAGDDRDTVQIEWQNMGAEPNFVITYYKNELSKKNYLIKQEINETNSKQFSFQGINGISGTLYIKSNDDKKSGTEYAVLTVNLSPPGFTAPTTTP